jgi:flavin-dependent dehydrogenase
VLIIGGGPAGAAAATLLGRAGVDVVLLERGRRAATRGKVCGEGILPPGVPVLEELGVRRELEARGATALRGLRYVAPSGGSATADFPTAAGVGLTVPRAVLDRVLWDAAARHVDARRGVAVRGLLQEHGRVVGVRTDAGEMRARLVIAADGLASVAHRHAEIRCARPRRVRVGLSAHWSGVSGLDGRVEVLVGCGWELYVAPQGDGCALVAALVDGRALAGGAGAVAGLYQELLRSHPGLRGRLERARLLDEPRALGPLGLEVEPRSRPGLLLTGDAAGALDPITGEGLSLALRSARDLAECLPCALGGTGRLREACARVTRRRDERLRDLRPLTRLALALSRHPALAERAIRGLARHPDVFERLLAVACETAPYTSIRLRDKARLALA